MGSETVIGPSANRANWQEEFFLSDAWSKYTFNLPAARVRSRRRWYVMVHTRNIIMKSPPIVPPTMVAIFHLWASAMRWATVVAAASESTIMLIPWTDREVFAAVKVMTRVWGPEGRDGEEYKMRSARAVEFRMNTVSWKPSRVYKRLDDMSRGSSGSRVPETTTLTPIS